MKIPSHYNRLMLYIIVPNAYKFLEFMKNVFNATEQAIIPGATQQEYDYTFGFHDLSGNDWWPVQAEK
jgi:uncharacterized glyoxalase superfamily protein PhnB